MCTPRSSCLRILIVMCLALNGCRMWTPIENPGAVLEEQASRNEWERSMLRFHVASDSTVEGQVSEIHPDTVWVQAGLETETAIPRDQVTGLDAREVDVGRTALGAGLVAGMIVALGVYYNSLW